MLKNQYYTTRQQILDIMSYIGGIKRLLKVHTDHECIKQNMEKLQKLEKALKKYTFRKPQEDGIKINVAGIEISINQLKIKI